MVDGRKKSEVVNGGVETKKKSTPMPVPASKPAPEAQSFGALAVSEKTTSVSRLA